MRCEWSDARNYDCSEFVEVSVADPEVATIDGSFVVPTGPPGETELVVRYQDTVVTRPIITTGVEGEPYSSPDGVDYTICRTPTVDGGQLCHTLGGARYDCTGIDPYPETGW